MFVLVGSGIGIPWFLPSYLTSAGAGSAGGGGSEPFGVLSGIQGKMMARTH